MPLRDALRGEPPPRPRVAPEPAAVAPPTRTNDCPSPSKLPPPATPRQPPPPLLFYMQPRPSASRLPLRLGEMLVCTLLAGLPESIGQLQALKYL